MSVTFNPQQDIPDLSGKVIFVTGGNAGLGAATIQALAAHNPGCIYLSCRRVEAGQQLIDSIHETNPKANLKVLRLDQNSLENVKSAAEEFNKQSDRLDILINNAGISCTAAALTKDGYEETFGVNHVAHAYLTQLLMPKMLETHEKYNKDIRVVTVSSVGAYQFGVPGGIPFDDLKTTMTQVAPIKRYAVSKLANILFANKVALEYPQIISTSVHPGTVKSDIWGKAVGAKWLMRIFAPVVWWTGVDIHEGAKTQLWTATGEGVKTGTYYEPVGKVHSGGKNAQDAKLRDDLWEWTNKELKQFGAPGWPQA